MKKLLLPLLVGAIVFYLVGKGCGSISSSSNNPKAISGMMPVDVYLNMEKQGFTTDKQLGGEYGNLWLCTKKTDEIDFEVKCFSHDVSSVETVRADAMITGSKRPEALENFITMCATFPYTSAKPDDAKEWVVKNFNNNKATTVINGVRFTIYSPTRFVRMLELEKAK
jgi:hypothetical protein